MNAERGLAVGLVSREFPASMEPRSFERGKRSSATSRVNRVHASMEPRSFERGKSSLIPAMSLRTGLQWSRVRLNAESFLFPLFSIVQQDASMEPRSFERGKLSATSAAVRRVFASMEPRSFERGKTARLRPHRQPIRGFNGAAFV